MAKRASIQAISFTDVLLPTGEKDSRTTQEEGLLPLVRRWLLTLLISKKKVELLASHSALRRLLMVGDPDYWQGHEDDPIHFEDDIESGTEAKARRTRRWANQLLANAQAQARAQTPDYMHPLFVNIQELGELLGLNGTDRVVLCFIVLTLYFAPFETAVDCLQLQIGTEADLADIISLVTGCQTDELRRSISRISPLRSTALLKLARESTVLERYVELRRGIGPLLLVSHENTDALVQFLLTARQPTTLTENNFPHLAGDISLMAGILGEAMRKKIAGTNILLYGLPGGGKTELASVVAQRLGAALYEVGYADENGDPIRGTERLSAYALSQRLLAKRTDALLLFDEVEDMLEDGETPGKAWVNRSLEENPVPAIWITNNERAMDPAYLRRFDYSVCVGTPPKSVRKQIATHYLKDLADIASLQEDAEIGESWIESLVENSAVTPSQFERAAKVTRLVEAQALEQGDQFNARQRIEQVLNRSSKLLRQPKPRTGRTMATTYDLAYLHTDTSIPEIVDSLRHSASGTFCFYGPPGVGKTAFAQHIAKDLELPLVLRRASDLLDCYLGGTEKNIAAMFTAAKVESCVLVLDEADSFLQSRGRAQRSWEITQVNELLTQMEDFEGIFICTTNLMEALDAASLRRFDWKISFKVLTSSQRWALFLQEFHMLGGNIESAMPLENQVRKQLSGIAPGDFAPVTRQYRLLRRSPTHQEFLQRLTAELANKSIHGSKAQHNRVADTRMKRLSDNAEAN